MIPGVGAVARIGDQLVFCGRVADDEQALDALRHAGKAALVVKINNRSVGVISLSDELRPEAAGMVRALRNLGCRLMLLTGDHPAAAEMVARQVDLREVHASLLPAEKLRIIAEVEATGACVCMLGDGVNDAPALKQAYIGIAMGGMGSEIARDAADITLMSDNLETIPYIKRLANAMLRTICFNLTVSMMINLVAISLSVMGVLGPISGALVHNAGSVLVVLNAALLYERKFKE